MVAQRPLTKPWRTRFATVYPTSNRQQIKPVEFFSVQNLSLVSQHSALRSYLSVSACRTTWRCKLLAKTRPIHFSKRNLFTHYAAVTAVSDAVLPSRRVYMRLHRIFLTVRSPTRIVRPNGTEICCTQKSCVA